MPRELRAHRTGNCTSLKSPLRSAAVVVCCCRRGRFLPTKKQLKGDPSWLKPTAAAAAAPGSGQPRSRVLAPSWGDGGISTREAGAARKFPAAVDWMRLSTRQRRLQEARGGLVKHLEQQESRSKIFGVLVAVPVQPCLSFPIALTHPWCPVRTWELPTVPLLSLPPCSSSGNPPAPSTSLPPRHLQMCRAGASAASLCHCPHLQ